MPVVTWLLGATLPLCQRRRRKQGPVRDRTPDLPGEATPTFRNFSLLNSLCLEACTTSINNSEDQRTSNEQEHNPLPLLDNQYLCA